MPIEPSAYVQQAEETEQQLIARARQAINGTAWIIGECAAKWTERYARGRTDGDFGQLIGMDRDQVCQRRRVWELFSDVSDSYHNLSWSHFYAAVGWDDAAECLQWADEMEATVAEMKAWRRAQRGEDLAERADDEPFEFSREHANNPPPAEPEPLQPTPAMVRPVGDEDEPEDDDEPEPDVTEYTPFRPDARTLAHEAEPVAAEVTRVNAPDRLPVPGFSERLDNFERAVLSIEGHVHRIQIAQRLRTIADRLEAQG